MHQNGADSSAPFFLLATAIKSNDTKSTNPAS